MRIKMRFTAVAAATALALAVPAMVPAFASPSDGVAPATVGVLLQNPAPDAGGVPVGGMYAVSAYVSAGDQTTNTPTDRSVSLTFPTGVTVVLYRMVPGREPVLIPVTGTTVTDKATAVPVTASVGWLANVVVDEATAPGTKLVTTATSAGKTIGSVSVTTVAAGTAPCADTLCVTASTGGSPLTKFGPTQTRAGIYWSATAIDPKKDLGSLVAQEVWGSSTVYRGTGTPGAPSTGEALDAYLAAWIVSQGGGRLTPGAGNVTSGPKLRPGFYTVRTQAWGAFYGVTAEGGVYAQSAERLVQRATATIAVAGPVKAAPKPRVITTNTPAAG